MAGIHMFGGGAASLHACCVSSVVCCRACHNLLKAHAAAVKTYRTWYQPSQKGKIGFVTNVVWAEPLTNSVEGVLSAHHARQLGVCWLHSMGHRSTCY